MYSYLSVGDACIPASITQHGDLLERVNPLLELQGLLCNLVLCEYFTSCYAWWDANDIWCPLYIAVKLLIW